MSKIFLITRPQHEYRICYLHAWSKEIVDFATKKGINFTDFDKKQSTKANVEKYLKKRNPEFVVFNGHGPESGDEILGHEDKTIIKAGQNTNLLKNSIIYARACFSSKILGKDVISSGAKSYIGYSGPFSWVHSSDRECNPFKDNIAEPFKMISNEIPLSILNGHTTSEAHERAKALCLKLLQDFSSTGNEDLDKEIRFWLFFDMNIQEHLGDPDATF